MPAKSPGWGFDVVKLAILRRSPGIIAWHKGGTLSASMGFAQKMFLIPYFLCSFGFNCYKCRRKFSPQANYSVMLVLANVSRVRQSIRTLCSGFPLSLEYRNDGQVIALLGQLLPHEVYVAVTYTRF